MFAKEAFKILTCSHSFVQIKLFEESFFKLTLKNIVPLTVCTGLIFGLATPTTHFGALKHSLLLGYRKR